MTAKEPNDELQQAFSSLWQAISGGDKISHSDTAHGDRLNLVRNALDRRAANLSTQPAEIIAGSFTVDHIAYQGRHSMVYKAIHRDICAAYAIKTIPIAFRDDITRCENLRQEAATGLKLRHPNLVETSLLLRLNDARPAILMPWHALSLAEAIRQKLFSPDHIRPLIAEILAGLEAVHDADYVHGDIRPQNILMGQKNNLSPRLGDFGLTVQVGVHRSNHGYKKAYDPVFSAPEQRRGDMAQSAQDIYSIGKLAEHLQAQFKSTPYSLTSFIDHCCDADSEKRPRIASQALSIL